MEQNIIEQIEKDIDELITVFRQKMGIDASGEDYWVSGDKLGVFAFGDYYMNVEDIFYVVKNDLNADEVYAWLAYNADASTLELPCPNLKSWHKGCPRLSTESIQRILKAENQMQKEIDLAKRVYEAERCRLLIEAGLK